MVITIAILKFASKYQIIFSLRTCLGIAWACISLIRMELHDTNKREPLSRSLKTGSQAKANNKKSRGKGPSATTTKQNSLRKKKTSTQWLPRKNHGGKASTQRRWHGHPQTLAAKYLQKIDPNGFDGKAPWELTQSRQQSIRGDRSDVGSKASTTKSWNDDDRKASTTKAERRLQSILHKSWTTMAKHPDNVTKGNHWNIRQPLEDGREAYTCVTRNSNMDRRQTMGHELQQVLLGMKATCLKGQGAMDYGSLTTPQRKDTRHMGIG